MPAVFEVSHANQHGVLLHLRPSQRFYFVTFLASASKLNYPDKITEQFEATQPRCGIGSFAAGTSLDDAIGEADKANATWHVTAPGVPITRTIEEIIKMDYGMRVFGSFI
jgi:hypothetical protein